jgi:hypothetical protein
MRVLLFASVALASCATSPATRSPLREQLAHADSSQVEEATRACLTAEGWKVDPISELVSGMRRVNASKTNDRTEVYLNQPDVKPRITGGPDWDDLFWKCLGPELGGKRAAPAESAESPSKDTP